VNIYVNTRSVIADPVLHITEHDGFAIPEVDFHLQQVNIIANEMRKASVQENAFIKNLSPSSSSYHLTVLIGTEVPRVAIIDNNYDVTFVTLLQQFASPLLLAFVCHKFVCYFTTLYELQLPGITHSLYELYYWLHDLSVTVQFPVEAIYYSLFLNVLTGYGAPQWPAQWVPGSFPGLNAAGSWSTSV
jgi:hypothetical protein